MSTLELKNLVHQAAQAAQAADGEAARQLQICNACRYCEGFCAVFPAMTRRLEFAATDVHYLANLCHNCGACLHACQYAPPHEFAVALPQALARVRGHTYTQYAWPRPLAHLYERHGLWTALALAAGLALFLVLMVARQGSLWHAPLAGQFYAVFPHGLLVALFLPVFAWAVLALGLGVWRFWHQQAPGRAEQAGAAQQAVIDVLTLTHLGGGQGQGCHDDDDAWSPWRRRFHHCTFYGFMLCFAATSLATLYHYVLQQPAPYPFWSLPVLLGTLGGLGLLIGPVGLHVLSRRRPALQKDETQQPLDTALLALLFFTSLTGLLLLALRNTSAMGLLLAVHLGVVMALFVMMPYGKMAHGVYRAAALLKHAVEQRQKPRITIADV
jgi:citrate/tricarballylate utilization protein